MLRAPSLTGDPRPSRITRRSYGSRVPDRTMVAKFDHCFCFAGFGTDRLRCEEAMKTAGRGNPNRWAKASSNRAHGAAVQNRSRSIKWAVKQENVQPADKCFFLTSPFIELPGTYRAEMSHNGLIPTISQELSIHRVREVGCANAHQLPERLHSQLQAQFPRLALHRLRPREDPCGQGVPSRSWGHP